MKPLGPLLVVVLLLTGAGGCTVSGSKAGPDDPQVVIRLATAENATAPYAASVRDFADRVGRLTGGGVRVDIDFEAIRWTQASEATLTRMVRDGRLDLALVPPRVFDTVGIPEFAALQTPMLIDTPELAGAVATGEVGEKLLAGLGDDGLVGLGLVYEGLRRPLATNGAVTRADQFRGLPIRVSPSGVGDQLFRALGAVPDHSDNHATDSSGKPFVLVETEFQLAGTDFPTGSTMTANLVFFPKYDALLANSVAFHRLTDAQQQAVRRAARETAEGSASTTEDDEAAAARFCEIGGQVVLAPPDQLDAARRLLSPVTAELRTKTETAATVTAIEALKTTVNAPTWTLPAACHQPSGDGARLPSEPPAPQPR